MLITGIVVRANFGVVIMCLVADRNNNGLLIYEQTMLDALPSLGCHAPKSVVTYFHDKNSFELLFSFLHSDLGAGCIFVRLQPGCEKCKNNPDSQQPDAIQT
jgi:hypothetical protein